VKLVVPVRLYPGAISEAALRDTLALCNQAANLTSAQAFRMRARPDSPCSGWSTVI
jgi:putative transposase